MTCCPGPNCAAAARQFDGRVAAGDLARYRRRGLPPTSRLLLSGLRGTGRLAGTLLDIGAGIGALTLELLDSGVESAVAVDASPAYVAAGREEAARRGRADRLTWLQGDFVQLERDIPPATTVTLDRVVCCYPDYRELLGAAIAHAERRLALSYPRDRWYVRWAVAAGNAVLRVKGSAFRSFVHPPSAMAGAIRERGFRLAWSARTAVWCVEVWETSKAATREA